MILVVEGMKTFFLPLLWLTSLPGFAQDQWKNVYTESAWTERDSWQKADVMIKQLAIQAGNRVADVGCHEGYMTVKLSKAVGPAGLVYAVDIEQTKLDKLKMHLGTRKITNVSAVKADSDNPKLPERALDAVLILDSYHEMKEHDKILQAIKSSLRPGGRLVICEPIAEDRRALSRTEQESKHELGLSFALEDLRKAGFQIVFRQDRFVDREKIKGDKMWIVVAKKSGNQ
jgi:ubiquinone/menaquinone biosynthesis C-methylase UbiE